MQMSEKEFIELWELGMKEFEKRNPHFLIRWCVSAQMMVDFEELKILRCWNCVNFNCNGGICDPL